MRTALAANRNRYALASSGYALAMAGDEVQAAAVADELSKAFPTDALVVSYWMPSIRGQIEISKNNPAKAVELLQVAIPLELGWPARMMPSYSRGQGYLRLHQGKEAAEQFQNILSHRGICGTLPACSLAHLCLGRAQALSADTRGAYQDFFALWKDADPDVPILKEAKAEYEKLVQ